MKYRRPEAFDPEVPKEEWFKYRISDPKYWRSGGCHSTSFYRAFVLSPILIMLCFPIFLVARDYVTHWLLWFAIFALATLLTIWRLFYRSMVRHYGAALANKMEYEHLEQDEIQRGRELEDP